MDECMVCGLCPVPHGSSALSRREQREVGRQARREAEPGNPQVGDVRNDATVDTPLIGVLRRTHERREVDLGHAFTRLLDGTLEPFLNATLWGFRPAPPDARGPAARESDELVIEIVRTLAILVSLREQALRHLDWEAAHACLKIEYAKQIITDHHPDAYQLGGWKPVPQVARLYLARIPEIYRAVVEELLNPLAPGTAARFRKELLAAS